jgi:threonyl-tRNA synthetase
MQLLLIHADNFGYKLTGKTPVAEDIDRAIHENEFPENGLFENALVVFSTVESLDSDNPDGIIEDAFLEIKKLSEKLKPSNIVIYPYAHLSSDLGSPSLAIKILDALKSKIASGIPSIPVFRPPFGWYKSFSIACKGHPLSESSRHITPETLMPPPGISPVLDGYSRRITSSAIENNFKETDTGAGQKAKAKIKAKTREDIVGEVESSFFILNFDGSEIPIDITDKNILDSEILTKFPSLNKFIAFEEFKIKEGVEPPSVQAMRKLEIADHEENSDSGHLRLYPKGTLIYKLLSDWAEDIALNNLKCMEIETPLIYNWNKPEIKGQGESFHERHYSVMVPDEKLKGGSMQGGFDKTKEFVLRFAGDFGLFSMVKDAKFSYKQLPLRFYESSKSFRYEKSGELSGLRRLRAFTMPDIHSFCLNLEEGFNEYQELYKQYSDLADATKIEYAVVFRIVKEYYDKHKDKIVSLLKYSKKPALIEILSKMKHYWALKHEFQGIDSAGGSCQLSTVQLDVEDAERYGINFVNEKGEKTGCIICHSSVGAIERWMYLILEEALKKEIPVLPLWLSITQVRIIPVSEKYMDYALTLMKALSSPASLRKALLSLYSSNPEILNKALSPVNIGAAKDVDAGGISPIDVDKVDKMVENIRIRVDVDDRDFSMNKKIMFAEEEWVPYILVIGEREKNSPLKIVENGKTFDVESIEADILSVRNRYKGRGTSKMSLMDLVIEITKETEGMPFRKLILPELLSKRPTFVG